MELLIPLYPIDDTAKIRNQSLIDVRARFYLEDLGPVEIIQPLKKELEENFKEVKKTEKIPTELDLGKLIRKNPNASHMGT